MSTPSSDGRPQKRFRIGTKSCAECRRRKVRCDYPSNSQICTGCSLHGAECVPQKAKASGEVTSIAHNDTHARLAELEKMVRQLCQTIEVDAGSSFSDIMDAAKTLKTIRGSSSVDGMSPDKSSDLSQDATVYSEHGKFENAPLLDLFKEAMDLQQYNGREVEAKHDDSFIRNCLQSLNKYIPNARDLSLVIAKTGYFLNVCYAIPMDLSTNGAAGDAFRERYIVNSLKSNDRIGVARGILCVALCVQQLPRVYYSEQVNLPYSQITLVNEYLNCAETLLASVETASPTTDGLICLMLLSKVYMDIGKPRRSWLGLRRALNLGILLGIHHSSDPSQVAIWSQIWQTERRLGLNLGFPSGISDIHLRLSPQSGPEERLLHRMGIIVGRIMDRNQDPDSDYSITQEIDQDLQRCKDDMPPGWWDAPTDMLQTDALFTLLSTRAGYFNYVKLLHLPYMFKPNGSSTSKFKALEAARSLIECYLILRRAREIIACDLMDFVTFSSAVVIIINLLSTNDPDPRDLETVIEIRSIFRYISEAIECSVASQAANVLNYLLKAYEGKYQDPNGYEATIPYFGRVKINFLKKPTEVMSFDDGGYWNAVEFNANSFLTSEEWQMGQISDQELGIDWSSFNWDGNYEWSQVFETRGVL